MSPQEIAQLSISALWLALLLSLPPVLIAALVGTMVSMLQAATQVQEQTLAFAAKMVATFGTLVVVAGWFGHTMMQFGDRIFIRIGQLLSYGP